mmetsp:Transcript_40661/g.97479  ORF Transcript_40661/g.97479 Transcript_40661/m.97479 type:complete len:248 (+) Transcript_40661:1260-2003(+)
MLNLRLRLSLRLLRRRLRLLGLVHDFLVLRDLLLQALLDHLVIPAALGLLRPELHEGGLGLVEEVLEGINEDLGAVMVLVGGGLGCLALRVLRPGLHQRHQLVLIRRGQRLGLHKRGEHIHSLLRVGLDQGHAQALVQELDGSLESVHGLHGGLLFSGEDRELLLTLVRGLLEICFRLALLRGGLLDLRALLGDVAVSLVHDGLQVLLLRLCAGDVAVQVGGLVLAEGGILVELLLLGGALCDHLLL